MISSIRSIGGHRTLSLVVLATLIFGLVVAYAPPANAGVEGGCNGSADFTEDSVGAYTPDNDTVDNAIIVPKADGNVAAWTGNVPGNNENFSGQVDIQIGPFWVTVGDWGFPNFNGENSLDGRMDSGDYNMDEFWDAVGNKDLIQGVYNARGSHTADGVNCTAQFMVKFEGSPIESPVVIVSMVILVLAVIMIIIAGRRKKRGGGFFKGRPILVIIAMLLLAITIAILLQQYCKVPLNNTTVIFLPIILIIIGLIIAKIAPFGGGSLPNGADLPNGGPLPGGVDTDDVSEAIEDSEIFTDGFESGDTSAWSDTTP